MPQGNDRINKEPAPQKDIKNQEAAGGPANNLPKLLVFDLNGTLVTFPIDKEIDIFAKVYKSITDQELPQDIIDKLKQGKQSKETIYQMLFEGRYNIEELVVTAKKLHKEIKKSPDRYGEYVLADGAGSLLELCKERGIKIAVLTNSPQAHAFALVEKFFPNFEIIIKADAGKDRLNPQAGVPALRALMQECGVTADRDVWFAGNGIKDQQTARAANVHFCFIGSCGEASVSTFSSLPQLHKTLSQMVAPAAQPSVM